MTRWKWSNIWEKLPFNTAKWSFHIKIEFSSTSTINEGKRQKEIQDLEVLFTCTVQTFTFLCVTEVQFTDLSSSSSYTLIYIIVGHFFLDFLHMFNIFYTFLITILQVLIQYCNLNMPYIYHLSKNTSMWWLTQTVWNETVIVLSRCWKLCVGFCFHKTWLLTPRASEGLGWPLTGGKNVNPHFSCLQIFNFLLLSVLFMPILLSMNERTQYNKVQKDSDLLINLMYIEFQWRIKWSNHNKGRSGGFLLNI